MLWKRRLAQNNSPVSEGGITVEPSQDSIHELIIWKVNPFVASVTFSRYQIAFRNDRWIFHCNFLVYDEMENISMGEISIEAFFKFKKTEPAEIL